MVNVHFDNIRQHIINALDKASERIIVAVYWFTNEELFDKLIEQIEKGCKVELIIHNDFINNRNTGLNFQHFVDKGGEFYFSDGYTAAKLVREKASEADPILVEGVKQQT